MRFCAGDEGGDGYESVTFFSGVLLLLLDFLLRRLGEDPRGFSPGLEGELAVATGGLGFWALGLGLGLALVELALEEVTGLNEREEKASLSAGESVPATLRGDAGRLMRMKSSERGEPGTALLARESSPELARLQTISSSEAESSAQRLDWDRTSIGDEVSD